SEFFFLPVLVAALTSADEFHSVTNTRWPSAISHLASSPSCVVFPEPSIPSTTNSFPGYSWGFVRLFNMGLSAHFHPQGPSDRALEWRSVPCGGPQFELGVARRPQLEQGIFAAIVQLEVCNRLRMTAIEALCKPQHRGEGPDDLPPLLRKLLVPRVTPLGRLAAMVPREKRDRLDLVGFEPAQVAVPDQVIRMLVVSFVADVHADIVQKGRIFQPFPLAIR